VEGSGEEVGAFKTRGSGGRVVGGRGAAGRVGVDGRPSTLSPIRLSSAWMGLIVSIMRLKSWATSEGGFTGVGEGSVDGVRDRVPESGSRKEETALGKRGPLRIPTPLIQGTTVTT
jgi:hypothetical protein